MTGKLLLAFTILSFECTVAKWCSSYKATNVNLAADAPAGNLVDCMKYGQRIFREQGTAVTIPATAYIDLSKDNWYNQVEMYDSATSYTMGERSSFTLLGNSNAKIIAPFTVGNSSVIAMRGFCQFGAYGAVTVGSHATFKMGDNSKLYVTHGGSLVIGKGATVSIDGHSLAYIIGHFAIGDNGMIKIRKYCNLWAYEAVTVGSRTTITMFDSAELSIYQGSDLIVGKGADITLHNFASFKVSGRFHIKDNTRVTLGFKATLKIGNGCQLNMGKYSELRISYTSTITLQSGAKITFAENALLKLGRRVGLTIAKNTFCIIKGHVPPITSCGEIIWNQEYKAGNVTCSRA